MVKTKIFEQLRYLNGAPSVQMQEIPPDIGGIQGSFSFSIFVPVFKMQHDTYTLSTEEVEQRIAEEESLKEKSRRKAERASGRVGELY